MEKLRTAVNGKVVIVFEENPHKAWAIGWVRTFGLFKGRWIALDNVPVHTKAQLHKAVKAKKEEDLEEDWEWHDRYYAWAFREEL